MHSNKICLELHFLPDEINKFEKKNRQVNSRNNTDKAWFVLQIGWVNYSVELCRQKTSVVFIWGTLEKLSLFSAKDYSLTLSQSHSFIWVTPRNTVVLVSGTFCIVLSCVSTWLVWRIRPPFRFAAFREGRLLPSNAFGFWLMNPSFAWA